MRRNPYDWTELVMDAVYSEPTVVRTGPAAVGVPLWAWSHSALATVIFLICQTRTLRLGEF